MLMSLSFWGKRFVMRLVIMKNKEYEIIREEIKKASESNQLVVFIGAGMSNNFGFPTWNASGK